MAVSTNIPASWKLPLFWATVDGSMAGGLTESQPALLVGEYLAIGVVMPNVPVPCASAAQAAQLTGFGSMLHRMMISFLAGNPTQQVWIMAVPSASAGQSAAGSIVFSGTSIQSGVLSTYIAGQLCAISVYSTDTPASVAANLVAAINAMTSLPVSAAVDGANAAKVDLTCRWSGATGNDIQVGFNYRGTFGGEAMPAGLSGAITAMAGGLGEPNFSAAIAAIASRQFYHVAMPYTDTGSLAAWDQEYGFGPGGRWAYQRQQYGWVFNAIRLDYADGLAWGLAHNSSVISTMIFEPATPTPMWETAAAYCAQGAAALLADPARPLQTLPLVNVLPAPISARFSQTELNDFVNSGLAAQAARADDTVQIVRESLQYQTNAYGQADDAFALVTVLSNLAELLTRLKAAITTKYPRHKLAPDGTAFGPGQAIVTPKIIKAELVAEAQQAIYDGLMSNLTAFVANLVVEIDDTVPNRLNILWAPQLMGQLRDFDVLAQFRLIDNSAATAATA